MVNYYYNLTEPELIKDEFKRLNEKIEELEDADEPNTVKIEKTRDRLTQLNERLREIRAGGDAQPKLTNTIAQRQIQYALTVDKIAIAGENQIDRPDLQVEKHIRRPDKIEEPRDDEPGESTILDIRSLSLFMKKNLVSWERRRFYIDNGYLNYWLNGRSGGVQPNGTMYLNGATLIVMDELKAKLKTSQTWSLKAGCPFCMEQLLVILSKYKVKIVLDEGMSAETKKKIKNWRLRRGRCNCRRVCHTTGIAIIGLYIGRYCRRVNCRLDSECCLWRFYWWPVQSGSIGRCRRCRCGDHGSNGRGWRSCRCWGGGGGGGCGLRVE
jgi:hypothetical protein